MSSDHLLLHPPVRRAIEEAATGHRGRRWVSTGFTDLDDRASHPCGVLHGEPFSVFAKLDPGPDAAEKFGAEIAGLGLVGKRAGVATPVVIGDGPVLLDEGALLLLEALSERPAADRTRDDWRAIGHTLATVHKVHADRFGLDDLHGFYGPLRQDNTPVGPDSWIDFYIERRVLPLLRSAVDSGHLPPDLAAGVEDMVDRMPGLGGPDPRPTLLHGDAQQNNFVSTDAGAVVVDVAPYFGHPEIDLALIDYFQPVPDDVLAAYAETAPLDDGFDDRREMWRIFAYLAGITVVDATTAFGRHVLDRLTDAVRPVGAG